MAIQLDNSFAVSLGNIVESSISAARQVHARELATKEAEFQAMVAEGKMSFQAQIDFRNAQLATERLSTFSDPEYIAQLEGSIASTKKQQRFDSIRRKYQTALDRYVQGKRSLNDLKTTLQTLIDGETDPDKLAELRGEMNSILTTIASNEVAAIQNRATVAQNDLSLSLIDKSISEIQDRRAKDSLNGNEEAVTAWDATLNSLNTSRSNIIIQNKSNEITYRTTREDLKIHQQVSLMDEMAKGADAATPFIYGGVQYTSEQDYWNRQRDAVINTNEFWQSLAADVDAETTRIASQSANGQIPISRIQQVNDFYNSLKNRPGFENYAARIDQERVSILDSSVNEVASLVSDEAQETGDFAKAQQTILTLERTFGVNITRTPLEGEQSFADRTTAALGAVPDQTTPMRKFTSVEDAQLKAAEQRVASGTATEADKANVDYAKKQGWNKQVVDVTKPEPVIPTTTTPTQITQQKGGSLSDQAPEGLTGVARQRWIEDQLKSSGTTTQQAATTSTKVKYSGSSLVDYLRQNKQDSSYTARKALATKYGINDYVGSSKQNLEILKNINI